MKFIAAEGGGSWRVNGGVWDIYGMWEIVVWSNRCNKSNIVSTYLKLNDGIPSLLNDNVIRSRANKRRKSTGGLFSL